MSIKVMLDLFSENLGLLTKFIGLFLKPARKLTSHFENICANGGDV